MIKKFSYFSAHVVKLDWRISIFFSLAIGQQRLKLSYATTASHWLEGFENSMPTSRTNATINSSIGTIAASRQLLSLGKAAKITKQTWMFTLLFQWRIGGPLETVKAPETVPLRIQVGKIGGEY